MIHQRRNICGDICLAGLGFWPRELVNVSVYRIAYRPPAAKTGQRGRPRIKGEAVKLFSLFETAKSQFAEAEISLYGKVEQIRYHYTDLLWGQGILTQCKVFC